METQLIPQTCNSCAKRDLTPALGATAPECFDCSSTWLATGVRPHYVPIEITRLGHSHTISQADPGHSHSIALPVKVMPEGAVGDVNSTAKGSGARYNAGKACLDLIPLRIIADSYEGMFNIESEAEDARCALRALGRWQECGDELFLVESLKDLGPLEDVWRDCADAFDYGRGKYAEWNWAKGMAWNIPLACAARHALAIMESKHEGNLDPESKKPHRGHFACNVVMLIQFGRSFPEGNNRPTMLAAA